MERLCESELCFGLCSSSWVWAWPKVAKRIAINSMKKMTKIVIRAMPSAQSYSMIGPVRQAFVRASQAGARSCVS